MNSDEESLDLPRLRFGSDTALAGALRAVKGDMPSDARLAAIAARLPASTPGVGLTWWHAKFAVAIACAVAVGGGIGSVVRHRNPVPAASDRRVSPAVVTTLSLPLAPPPRPAQDLPHPPPLAPRHGSSRPHQVAKISLPPPEEPSPQRLEDLEAETTLLAHAKRALFDQPAVAWRLAAEHERQFPEGILAQEREVIAVEALLKLGDRAAAEKRIATFAHRYPSSAHLRRLSTLLMRNLNGPEKSTSSTP